MTSTLELMIDGKLFSGWKGVSVDTSIEALSSSFYLYTRDKENVLSGLTAGVPCVGYAVNGNKKDVLIDGYITHRTRSITATSNNVSLDGGDKLIDFVQCSVVRENRSWAKKRFSRIVRDLADPYGLTVSTSALDSDPVIEAFTVQTGETSFDAAERLCRSQAVLPLSSFNGELVLGYSASDAERSDVDLVLGENIKRVGDDTDWNERFSEYTAVGQTTGNGKHWSKAMLQSKAVTSDETVTRYRPKLFVAENRSNSEELAKRAAWEAQIRAGRSDYQAVTVRGWYQRDTAGKLYGLWEKNKRVSLIVPDWDMNIDRLIVSVSYTLDEAGEQTTLGLRHPDTYKADPTAEVDLT